MSSVYTEIWVAKLWINWLVQQAQRHVTVYRYRSSAWLPGSRGSLAPWVG